MKVVLTCHTEYDLKNSEGRAEVLPAEKQTFRHLPMLRDLVEKSGLPMTWAFMVGGACGDRLIRFVSGNKAAWERTGELAIHFHSERFRQGKWVFEGFLTPADYEVYWKAYCRELDHVPRSVVFGKWKIDEPIFNQLKKWEIDHEGTALFPEKMITRPFQKDGMIKVPLLMAFDGKPLNPFTQISHWLYLNKLIKRFRGANVLLHLAMHSYDLFRFEGEEPVLKKQKHIVWKNLVGLIRRYGLEVLTLSDVTPLEGEDAPFLKAGFFSKLFNHLRH